MQDIFDSRLLVVDDQVANIKVLETLLRKAGYRNIESLTDPRGVLPRFMTAPPDMLLLDLAMPEIDGFGVMQQLQRWIGNEGGDFLPVLVLTADVTREARERSLEMGAKDFLTKPFDVTEARQRIGNLLETRLLHLQLKDRNDLLEERVRHRTADLWETVGRLEHSQAKLRESQEEIVSRLAIAAEFRDEETSEHIERVGHYSALLARLAGESPERQELIRLASTMHDIGKIGTPDNILLKPGPLTADERRIMQEHTEIGYRILARSDSELLQMAATIALTHHERIDGMGYPRRMAEDDIPLEGQIVAVADVFDALVTDRVYRDAFPLDEAVEIMKSGHGTQFDGELLDLFLGSLPEFVAIKNQLADRALNKTYVPGQMALDHDYYVVPHLTS